MRAKNLLELITGTGIVSSLLHNNIASRVDLERRINIRISVVDGAVTGNGVSDHRKRRVGTQLGLHDIGEINSAEDAEGLWVLRVDGIDPGRGAVDPGFAFGGAFDDADEGVDEVEVQHCVVGAEAEGGVCDGAVVCEVPGCAGACGG